MKLYVGNLSFQTSEGDLLDLFSQAGNVASASLVTDRDTGRSRGFAFVEMASKEEGEAAISQFNGVEIGGRALTVNEARPKESRGGGFGGGGRGGGFGGGGPMMMGFGGNESSRYSLTVQLRVTNVINRVNFNNYSGTLGSAFFGIPSSSGPARQMDLNLRFNF